MCRPRPSIRHNTQGVALVTAMIVVVILMTYSAILLAWAQTRTQQSKFQSSKDARAFTVLESAVNHITQTVFVRPRPQKPNEVVELNRRTPFCPDWLPVVIDFSNLKDGGVVRVGYPYDNPKYARKITFSDDRTRYSVKEVKPWTPSADASCF